MQRHEAIHSTAQTDHRVTHRLFALSASILIVGLGISSSLAQNNDWIDKSISDLGIDPSAGAIFNGTLIAFGLSTWPLMRRLRQALLALYPALLPRWGRFIVNSVLLTPFTIAGIGLVPYTTSIHLHNTFAALTVCAFVANAALIATGRSVAAPVLRTASGLFLLLFGATTAAYTQGQLSYVVYEFVLIAAITAWVYGVTVALGGGNGHVQG